MSHILCNLDGQIVDAAKATVSVLDRSFLFGDSIYEVVRTHRGRLFGVTRHLARLERSAARLGFEVPIDGAELRRRIVDVVAALGATGETYVRIVVTRGMASEPNIDPACTVSRPLVVLYARQLSPPDPRWRTTGLSARVVDVLRNDRRAIDPAIKSGNYLNNILGLMEARRHAADIALFLGTQGQLTESETSNVWLVHGDRLRTPSLESGILAGITRDFVLEMLRRDGTACEECMLTEADLRSADEVFLTSTVKDVCGITSLDGIPIGCGEVGPVTRDIGERFAVELDRLVAAESSTSS
ncbi:MAG: aminotransferase class IV [Planctomycetes bacterium]|nr:aminotransferase class IV [Planctomycetota bacterium]MCB9891265.1 aminotransferase class IV [Planctomycetota bacterium]MCB9919476.1 aminotransferase class IV [Planctomycetota bacterium]